MECEVSRLINSRKITEREADQLSLTLSLSLLIRSNRMKITERSTWNQRGKKRKKESWVWSSSLV